MDETALLERWENEARQPFQGWDFSYLEGRYHSEVPPWSYEQKVQHLIHDVDSLLDMGTGGGEKLIEFHDLFPKYTVATEGYAPNIPFAMKNLQPYGVSVIPYDSETDAQMPFADNSFARIINRHESYDAREIARVLHDGGIFCTQQVDGRNMEDLYSLFDMETAYPHVNLAGFQQELERVGLHIQEALDWQGKVTFADVSALIYYLRAVPWEAPADFTVQGYKQVLIDLHTRGTLTFTIRRFYLQATKKPPEN
jgi:hypothetical protein